MAQRTQRLLINGSTKVRLEDLPPEAWDIVSGGKGNAGDLLKLFNAVSWLYRGVSLIGNAAVDMPFDLMRRGEVIADENALALGDDFPDVVRPLMGMYPERMKQIAEALTLGGEAYLRWDGSLDPFRWMLPSSITPEITRDGLQYFKRRLDDGSTTKLEPSMDGMIGDVLHFWLPDMAVEVGPPVNYPGSAAMMAANVLHEMNVFKANYFERGLVKATLLMYEEQISPDEAARVKEWWRRVANGVKNAFANLVVRGDFKTEQIGEGLGELDNDSLTDNEIRAILAALGIKSEKVMEAPTGLGDVASPAEKAFITDTVAPLCSFIARQLNRQYLNPLGFAIVYNPQRLSIMQEDETKRSAALVNLTNAGMTLEAGLTVLGYDIPDGVVVEAPQPAMPEAEPDVPALDVEAEAELRQFRRWLNKRTNPDPDDFVAHHMTDAAKMAAYGEWSAEQGREAQGQMVEMIANAHKRFEEALSDDA